MSDYKRLVSYIYSYPGGVKDKNVGFAKAEVRNGQMKLHISLRGVYTDAAATFGIYLLMNGTHDSSLQPVYLGNAIVNAGQATYEDLCNAANINQSGYCFSDICGIGIASEENTFYRMFSLWNDEKVILSDIKLTQQNIRREDAFVQVAQVVQDAAFSDAGDDLKKQNAAVQQDDEKPAEMLQAQEEIPTCDMTYEKEQEANRKAEQTDAYIQEIIQESVKEETVCEKNDNQKIQVSEVEIKPDVHITELQAGKMSERKEEKNIRTLYEKSPKIDAFDDDYYYDCIEIMPEDLQYLHIEEAVIVQNSFLLHGFYRFHHLLFGKVRENTNGTRYFLGVPGMYCNRERFMASMYGFGNFKKSHRSDYSNPYFGYWYQEI